MVAWYSFSVRVRWPSSRVAFSTPTTSTPVAMGSRVPACPTRRVPASRRIRATTSWEVMPPGLSTTTSPLGAFPRASRATGLAAFRQQPAQPCDGVPGAAGQRDAGRVTVAAAAQLGAGAAHVDLALRPGGRLPQPVVGLLEDDGYLRLVGAPHHVDDGFDRVHGQAV